MFEGTNSGENPSKAVRGPKRVDLNYSTAEGGLGLAMSFKSVHEGEKANGQADFIHNMKRNDEETPRRSNQSPPPSTCIRYFVAVLFLPFEACTDLEPTSSFGSWVQYSWPLKGREEPEDPPDLFELVFISFCTQRDGRDFGFYEVGGQSRRMPPARPALSVCLPSGVFLVRVKAVYDRRNGPTSSSKVSAHSKTPRASSAAVTHRMQATKRRDTPGELALRAELRKHGLRYRVDYPLAGTRRRADVASSRRSPGCVRRWLLLARLSGAWHVAQERTLSWWRLKV